MERVGHREERNQYCSKRYIAKGIYRAYTSLDPTSVGPDTGCNQSRRKIWSKRQQEVQSIANTKSKQHTWEEFKTFLLHDTLESKTLFNDTHSKLQTYTQGDNQSIKSYFDKRVAFTAILPPDYQPTNHQAGGYQLLQQHAGRTLPHPQSTGFHWWPDWDLACW